MSGSDWHTACTAARDKAPVATLEWSKDRDKVAYD